MLDNNNNPNDRFYEEEDVDREKPKTHNVRVEQIEPQFAGL